jgi:dihydroorotase
VQALIRPGHLTWLQLIARLTKGPAEVMGLPCGTLGAGQAADITLIDPEAEWTVDAGNFASRSRNTPFHGQTLPAVVKKVLVDGVVRFSK